MTNLLFGGRSDINWLPWLSPIFAAGWRFISGVFNFANDRAVLTMPSSWRFNGLRELLGWGRMRDDAEWKKSLDLFNAYFSLFVFGEKSRSAEHFSVVPLHTLRDPIVILIKQQQSKRCETLTNKKKNVFVRHIRETWKAWSAWETRRWSLIDRVPISTIRVLNAGRCSLFRASINCSCAWKIPKVAH